MNKFTVALLLALLMPLSPGTLFAQFVTCPTPPTGPYEAGVSTWYDYTPISNCWSLSGVEPTTLSCVGDPGFVYGLGRDKTITYTFPIGPNDPVLANWWADAFIEFTDPNDDWFNQININARVVRNGTLFNYNLFHHNGTLGDLSGCLRRGGSFSATHGDTVTIEIRSSKWYSNTTIQSTGAFIFTTYP